MNIYIPSTSRSDEPNTLALKRHAKYRKHRVTGLERAHVAIILGDRHEMLERAHACIVRGVPYIHVGAGCETDGSWDQKFRDMLTMGSTIPWPYTERAQGRLRELVGAPFARGGYGVPVLDDLEPGGNARENFVLVALNPVTDQNVGEEFELAETIAEACKQVGRPVWWSKPNEDPQSKHLCAKMTRLWPGRQLDKRFTFATAIRTCHVMVGNSSAALIEAPLLHTPFVDCGCRQEGRPLATGYTTRDAIAREMDNPTYIYGPSPYRHRYGEACAEIIDTAEGIAQ